MRTARSGFRTPAPGRCSRRARAARRRCRTEPPIPGAGTSITCRLPSTRGCLTPGRRQCPRHCAFDRDSARATCSRCTRRRRCRSRLLGGSPLWNCCGATSPMRQVSSLPPATDVMISPPLASTISPTASAVATIGLLIWMMVSLCVSSYSNPCAIVPLARVVAAAHRERCRTHRFDDRGRHGCKR